MSVKNKIYLSLILQFLVILALAFTSIHYIRLLGDDAESILKDNYRTLDYMKDISAISNNMKDAFLLNVSTEKYMEDAAEIMTAQLNNITEPREESLSIELQKLLEAYQSVVQNSNSTDKEVISSAKKLQEQVAVIYDLNESAILKRSDNATKQADRIIIIMGALGMASIILGVVLLFIIPSNVAEPLAHFEDAVQKVHKGNYDIKVGKSEQQEYNQISEAFNKMAYIINSNKFIDGVKENTEFLRYREALNAIPQYLLIIDNDNAVRFINDQFYTEFKMSPKVNDNLNLAGVPESEEALSKIAKTILLGTFSGKKESYADTIEILEKDYKLALNNITVADENGHNRSIGQVIQLSEV